MHIFNKLELGFTKVDTILKEHQNSFSYSQVMVQKKGEEHDNSNILFLTLYHGLFEIYSCLAISLSDSLSCFPILSRSHHSF